MTDRLASALKCVGEYRPVSILSTYREAPRVIEVRPDLCHTADTARLGCIPPRMPSPREIAAVRVVRMVSQLWIEGRRQDELAAEPAGGRRPRGHNPLHFAGNRRAHCRGAAGKPASCRSTADAYSYPNCNSTPYIDANSVAANADAPTRAADAHARSCGRHRRRRPVRTGWPKHR